MIAWQYWSIMLLPFLFPNPILLTQNNMTLSKAQISSIKVANEKFQLLKNYCKENNLDINTLLTPNQKKEMKEGIAFLKEFLPQIKENTLNEDDVIPKGVFLKTVQTQLDSLIASPGMELIKNDLNRFSIDLASFALAMNKISLKTPFGKELRSKVLSKSSNTVASIFDAVHRVIGEYKNKNGKLLKEHYSSTGEGKNYKEYYKKEEVIISDLISDLDKLGGSLDDCITSSIDDPSYPPNIERAEQKAKKEKALKEDMSKFRQVYADWYKESINNVRNIDNELKDKELPRDIFILALQQNNAIWKQAQPELAKRLSDLIVNELKKETVSVRDCAAALNNALSKEDFQTTIGINVLYDRWGQNNILPNLNALIGAVEKAAKESQENQFVQQHINWYKEVFSIVDSLECPTSTRFVKKAVLDSLSKCFQSSGRNYLYPIVEKNIAKVSNNAPLENYIQAWKIAMNEIVVDGDIIEIEYLKLKGMHGNNLDKVLERYIQFPDKEAIKRAFDKSNQYIYKSPKLIEGTSIQLKGELNDATKLNIHLKVHIVKEEGEVYAIPTEISLDGVDNGSKGYSFALGEIAPQAAKKEGELYKTYFEFSLNFEKNRGSVSKGSEHSDTFKQQFGIEKGVSSGHSHTYNRTGEVGLEVLGYQIEEGDDNYKDTTITNAFAIEFENTNTDSNLQTIDKGVMIGTMNIQLLLESSFVDIQKIRKTTELEVNVTSTKITPTISKGLYFVKNFEIEDKKRVLVKK